MFLNTSLHTELHSTFQVKNLQILLLLLARRQFFHFHFHFLMLFYLSIESLKKNKWICKYLFNAYVLHLLIRYNMHHVFCIYAFLYYVLHSLILIIWLYLAVIWILSHRFLRCFNNSLESNCILHDHILTCSLLQEWSWNRQILFRA